MTWNKLKTMELKDKERKLLKLNNLRRRYNALQSCAEAIQETSNEYANDLHVLPKPYEFIGLTIGDMAGSISDLAGTICDALFEEIEKLNKSE